MVVVVVVEALEEMVEVLGELITFGLSRCVLTASTFNGICSI